jgi:L-xylulokinase
MAKRYYIGLDNGGSVSKAGLFDDTGKEIAISQTQLEPIMHKAGYVERDAEELYQANIKCIRDVIEKSNIDVRDIAALAVTGFGNGLFLVGEDGKPVYNAVISTDTRAAEHVKNWYMDGTFDNILPKTNQVIWAGQIGPLLAWFKANMPEVINKTRYAFTCTDFIRFKLTGQAYGEMSNMSAASIMNIKEKKYDEDVLDALGIRACRNLLSPLKNSDEICGRITKEASRLTGIPEGTPVAGGMVDFAACPIATGVTNEDLISAVVGTWSINSYIAKEPIVDRSLFMNNLYPMEGYYQLWEGSMTSASNLEWFVHKFMREEKIEMAKVGRKVYQACDDMVAKMAPQDCPIVFLPFLFGTNVNPDAKACFLGINYMHDKSHMLRAIFEGVVFSTMFHVEKLLKLKKSPPKSVRISGGAANSRVWVQMFADTLNLPVEVSQAKELGAMGAAMSAAVSTGEFKTFKEAAQKYVNISYTCYPEHKTIDIYNRKYEFYKRVIEQMNDLWSQWA